MTRPSPTPLPERRDADQRIAWADPATSPLRSAEAARAFRASLMLLPAPEDGATCNAPFAPPPATRLAA
jgi:hypothetical protein